MPPKRRAPDTETARRRSRRRPKRPKRQKAAITQFMSFTNMDRNAAVRVLKSHGWDAQNAVNA
ncbi:Scaffold-type E3 ligase [Didymella pomorum]|uniref:Scaffold-type E3 ligase n=1 Tax=Didymella pomorum TaxID=749634 RepID=A0A9W8ZC32_9PLEO|nr:Scaffold-type E3 ligase [Didymella pomorum]